MQDRKINTVDGEYNPYNFYFRFFSNKRLDNNNNDVVYAVSQSKIIEMYDKGLDDVNRYYMNRDESNNIIQYNLSDYFEFGTLVYPEEFVALQNSKTKVRCSFKKSTGRL